jgi:HEPN domain-containing protein
MVEKDILSNWFRHADMDLFSAEKLREHYPYPIEVVCFHCQQAAEKYLKGYLYANGNADPPHIHSLIALRAMCEDIDSLFTQLIDDCTALNPYSVLIRYSDKIELFEHDMQKALKCAERIRDFAPIVKVREEIGYNKYALAYDEPKKSDVPAPGKGVMERLDDARGGSDGSAKSVPARPRNPKNGPGSMGAAEGPPKSKEPDR